MPTVLGGRVRLEKKEKEILEMYAGEPVNPVTVQDLNAWVDHLSRPNPEDTPEERLMRAVILGFRIEGNKRPKGSATEKHDTPAKVINLF